MMRIFHNLKNEYHDENITMQKDAVQHRCGGDHGGLCAEECTYSKG